MTSNPVEEFVTLFNEGSFFESAKEGECSSWDAHDGAQLTLMGWEPDENSDDHQVSLSLEALGTEDVNGSFGSGVELLFSIEEFDNLIADLISFRDRFMTGGKP